MQRLGKHADIAGAIGKSCRRTVQSQVVVSHGFLFWTCHSDWHANHRLATIDANSGRVGGTTDFRAVDISLPVRLVPSAKGQSSAEQ